MNSKPIYVILVAQEPLRHATYIYELNYVPLGAPYEWCDADELDLLVHTRKTEKPQFNYQIHYVTD